MNYFCQKLLFKSSISHLLLIGSTHSILFKGNISYLLLMNIADSIVFMGIDSITDATSLTARHSRQV